MYKFNILVTGANGQVGNEIQELSAYYVYKFYFASKDELDITKLDDIKNYIRDKNINVIINCAAYTAVDKAEEEVELAFDINKNGVKNLAIISKEKNIKLVHISTDYVFDGKNFKPYLEDDKISPRNIYGKSKLDGENEILDINPKSSIIIRTSWVYGYYGKNFIKTMLRLGKERNNLAVVFDQIGTPTYAKDLAKVILDIIPFIKNENVNIYNYSNEGVVSWYDFAKEIIHMTKLVCDISPVETKEYLTPAIRPHFSVLNKAKIKKEFGIKIPYWKDSLRDCLERLGEKR
ncbi:dTDP-4-dehydrorhamnose reductase [Campylobacter geochelonis]|uniref:dTDP-4-dehydrorhamnose reductase n=1 Tax=Campylobacter geochelonis TaxID=1780362 RepID=A0A128EJM2_9BACT|nr:dTDP-4-dehydrorhamnose reductase [Campylobacter geochelonis]QKF71226.1 dTDP-4-dehydrorhamnose reductase [Campylobacter geochelonis]CZE49145.1 dTDP-4-dehydrorhamnose reductase [Campylobacter geochelonis]